ncbi:putative nuclease HARBI1 [Rhagoletis pomonella]|uniref:putative nuclease HARBI1 n=1 Tax=Rhagoletis pomonella TaxID=28610 RepID=UPI00177EEF49|nr:putative nuclease HARBI1 [Rhagoletis pomonella]
MTEDEKTKSKQHFHQNFGIPGVIGCVDGTHIKITKPHKDSSLFYNRKGYFSINAMIICDYNMVIRAVDARRPGSSHDALIWSVSRAHDYFKRNYDNGERGLWLLGDAGHYKVQELVEAGPMDEDNEPVVEGIINEATLDGEAIMIREDIATRLFSNS